MIVPTGTTAQRPAVAVQGMVRYNTENGGRLETYNGAAWGGIVSGGIGIDPANMPANTGTTVTFAFTGATVGGVVAISPSAALPNGIIIAWARVSAANQIQVRFENNSTAAVNPPSIGYNIRVIQ
jgi:plastocyanin